MEHNFDEFNSGELHEKRAVATREVSFLNAQDARGLL
jgi:hypothetical protein